MSIQEVSAERLAELFHHYHQALGADFGAAQSHKGWDQMSSEEKSRLIAATRLSLLELAESNPDEEDRQRYFAKPGEAEWGC